MRTKRYYFDTRTTFYRLRGVFFFCFPHSDPFKKNSFFFSFQLRNYTPRAKVTSAYTRPTACIVCTRSSTFIRAAARAHNPRRREGSGGSVFVLAGCFLLRNSRRAAARDKNSHAAAVVGRTDDRCLARATFVADVQLLAWTLVLALSIKTGKNTRHFSPTMFFIIFLLSFHDVLHFILYSLR